MLSKEMLSQGDDKGRHNEGPDVLSEAAMINAYYICHNVQVNWQAQQNREGTKKMETQFTFHLFISHLSLCP